MFSLRNFRLILRNKILINNINLLLNNSGLYLILGPSGGGKTTFVKIIYVLSKLFQINQKINIRNSKILKKYFPNVFNFEGYFVKRQDYIVGYAYQDFNLIKDLTVKDNIFFCRKSISISWYKYLMDYFELTHLEYEKINHLSGGEKARVVLVKALISKPQLLLIDESDSFLNYRLRNKLYDFLEEYSSNNLVFFITHNFNLGDVEDNLVIIKKK